MEREKPVRWDKTSMRESNSSAFEMHISRNAFTLLFSEGGADDVPEHGQSVAGSLNRIDMKPTTAKQLALAVNKVLKECETKYGQDFYRGPSQAETAQLSTLGEAPSLSEGVDEGNKSNLLFQLVRKLDVEAGYERSFKIANSALLQNRFLLGVSKKEVGPGAEERLTEACRSMGIPDNFLELFQEHFPLSDYIHFGFEQNEKTIVYKVYLEFFDTISEQIRKSSQQPGPSLLHLGLKWDAANPSRQALTRYTWHPWISSEEILQRVSAILEAERSGVARQAVERLISLAMARLPDRDILFLEVTEEGNPRRSFDINVYRANLQVAEIYPLLSMLCRSHSIPFDTFHSLYEGIKNERLGHLAAGIGREGNDFFTIYYGVQETTGDSSGEKPQRGNGPAGSAKYRPPARRRRIIHVEETDDNARRLYHLVKDLGMQGAFERSFKFLDGILLADRFLFGFRRPASDAALDSAIIDICRRVDMPEDHRELFESELNEASIVLFGFEKSAKGSIYKVYLEFIDRLKEAVRKDPKPDSVVIHNGFKWDVADNSRKVVAEYRALNILHPKDISVRLLEEIYGNKKGNSYRIVDDILDIAGTRTQPGKLIYFEVSEENNLRKSFDVNMYFADLQVAELYPMLVEAARYFSIEMDRFDELYEGVKDYRFGHVSGGIDRQGKDFLTFYFSERKDPGKDGHLGWKRGY
jgi:hypothetical protein